MLYNISSLQSAMHFYRNKNNLTKASETPCRISYRTSPFPSTGYNYSRNTVQLFMVKTSCCSNKHASNIYINICLVAISLNNRHFIWLFTNYLRTNISLRFTYSAIDDNFNGIAVRASNYSKNQKIAFCFRQVSCIS